VAGSCVHGTELSVFYKIRGIYSPNQELTAFRDGLSSMNLIDQSVMFDYESAQQDGTL